MKKIAFVTGGATGIGEATVRALCNDGYFCVVFCNKSVDEAKMLCDELNKNDDCAMYFRCDLSDYEETKKTVSEALSLFGRVDVLVNNAGIAQQKCFTDITYDDWKRMIDINLNSVFYMCSIVVPVMVKNHSGKIVNVSSMWGICGASCEVHYSASKAGIIGFTKALAQELGISGITVNCVAPGPTQTGWIDEELENAVLPLIPMAELIMPEDIAETILFLASEQARMITGQVIKVSGGHAL